MTRARPPEAVLGFLLVAAVGLALGTASSGMPQDLDGLYRSDDGAGLVLFPAPTQPGRTAMVELASGELRMLFPVVEDEYTFGPAIAVPEPVQGTLAIARDPDGQVRGVLRQDTGGAEREFARVGLREVPASFANGAVQLAGTLVLPAGPGPFPVAILLHGSEPERRQENLGIALLFASEGIGALVFDKRGVGESHAEHWQASFDEYARDAAAGFEWLRARPEVDARRIGFWGHSQGAWVAALAASRTKAAAFVVLECGGALDPIETTQWWLRRRLETQGRYGPEEIQALLAYRKRKFEVVAGRMSAMELEPFTAEARAAAWFPEITERLPDGRFWEANAAYDPRPALEGLGHCAVLALYAEHDDSTPSEASLAAARAAFERTRHPRAQVRLVHAANHGLFETEGGAPMERELSTLRRFAPEYAPLLLGWLKDATRL